MNKEFIERHLNNIICPDCNSKNIRIGQWNSTDSYVSPVKFDKKIYMLQRNSVFCCVCTDCGLIIKQFVERPENFKN